MTLSPGNKSDESFNFYLQKSIARWELSLTLLNMELPSPEAATGGVL